MKPSYPWEALELPGPSPQRLIKKHYARLAKLYRPDTNPNGFQELRRAYEWALRCAIEESEGQFSEQAQAATAENAPIASPIAREGKQAPMQESDESPKHVLINAANEAIEDDPWRAFQSEQADWKEAIHALFALTEVDRSNPSPLSAAQAADMAILVDRILKHPANANLSTAMHTEEALLRSAAYSGLWPYQSLLMVWERYQLEARVAFSSHFGDATSQIRAQLDDYEYWQSLHSQARNEPASALGAFFRDISWRDHIAIFFSRHRRTVTREVIEWYQTHPLIPKDTVPAQRVATLSRLLNRASYLPLISWHGLVFLLLCALSLDTLLKPLGLEAGFTWWKLMVKVLGVYAIVLCLHVWLMPWLVHRIRKRESFWDVMELIAIPSLLLGFGMGSLSPKLGAAIVTLAGVSLLCIWVAHQRFAFVLTTQLNLGQLISIGMLAFFCMAGLVMLFPKASSFGWPVVILVLMARTLPYPVIDLQAWNLRYALRSGYTLQASAESIWWILLGLLLCRMAFLVFVDQSNEMHFLNAIGIAVMVLAWLVVGFPQSFGKLAREYGLFGIFGVVLFCCALMLLVMRSTSGSGQHLVMRVGHVMLLSLLITRLVELLWRKRFLPAQE